MTAVGPSPSREATRGAHEWRPPWLTWGQVALVLSILFALILSGAMALRWQEWRKSYPEPQLHVLETALREVSSTQGAMTVLAQWDRGLNAWPGPRSTVPIRLSMVDHQGQLIYRSATFPREWIEQRAPEEGVCVLDGVSNALCGMSVSHELGVITVVYPGMSWVSALRSVLTVTLVLTAAFFFLLLLAMTWMRRQLRDRIDSLEPLWAQKSTTELCEDSRLWPLGDSSQNRRVRAIQERILLRVQKERAFAQNLAHELRTPLSVLMAQIHLFRRSSSTTQQGRAMHAIDKATRKMVDMTEQLLLWSGLKNGPSAAESSMRPVDLVALIRDCLLGLSYRAKEKSMDLSLEAPDVWWGLADKVALDCISRNLVDNAIRYGHEGGTVRVTFEPLPNRQVRLVVLDDGPGIEPEYREAIFDRFFRGSTQAQGSGLGLSIVKLCLQRINGRIELQAGEMGRGCMFTVHFDCPAQSDGG